MHHSQKDEQLPVRNNAYSWATLQHCRFSCDRFFCCCCVVRWVIVKSNHNSYQKWFIFYFGKYELINYRFIHLNRSKKKVWYTVANSAFIIENFTLFFKSAIKIVLFEHKIHIQNVEKIYECNHFDTGTCWNMTHCHAFFQLYLLAVCMELYNNNFC